MVNYNGIDRIYHLLKFAGWAFNPNWSQARKRTQFCFGASFCFLLLFMVGSELRTLRRLVREKNYELVFLGIGEIQTEICSLLNTSLFIVCAEKIRRLNTALKETSTFALKYSPQESASVFPQTWQDSNRYLNFLLWFFSSFVVGWASLPAYDFVRAYPNIDYGKTRLLFNNADFGLDRATYYWCITALHLVSAVILITTISSGFALVPLTCTLIRGQIAILLRSFDRIPECSVAKLQSEIKAHLRAASLRPPVVLKKRKSGNSSGLQEKSINLKNCIKHHQMILRVVKKTENVLAYFLFFNLTCCALCLINIAVAVTAANAGNVVLLYSVSAIVLLLQMFFLTWHLTILKETCSEVAFAAFSVGKRQPKARRELSFIICRSNREETFSCLLSTSLTFAGIFKILRLLWNYFTICRQGISTSS